MTFVSVARRASRGLGAALLSAGLLAACGGSTSQLETFIPTRLVVLGDETSALIDRDGNGNGYQYGMNGLDSTDTTNATINCADSSRLVWVQRLAASYGLVFKECNPSQLADSRLNALMLAKFGATVRAVEAQVANFNANIANEPLGDKDMVTVLIGTHDIVEIYSDNLIYGSEGEKLAEAEARGRRVALLVNGITDRGPRVLVSQIMDMGITPWALSQGTTEAKLLTRLSEAFNKGMRLELLNDGSKIGLLAVNDLVSNLSTFGGYNTTELACDEEHVEPVSVVDDDGDGFIDGGGVLSTCTTATVRSDTAAAQNLWVDGISLNARIFQPQLGSQAVSRARANPF